MLLSGGGGSKSVPKRSTRGFPMFKKLLITGAFLALPAAAIAADLPVKATAYAPARPACAQFGGWYAGGHAATVRTTTLGAIGTLGRLNCPTTSSAQM